jgi:hypothetical protein
MHDDRRAAKNDFRHDATSWMDLITQLDARTPGLASGRPVVVVVQPTHDQTSDHLIPCILSARNRSATFRDLLLDALMGSCLVEIGHIAIEHAARAASHRRSTDGRGILV